MLRQGGGEMTPEEIQAKKARLWREWSKAWPGTLRFVLMIASISMIVGAVRELAGPTVSHLVLGLLILALIWK
jgi:hypothetical protein